MDTPADDAVGHQVIDEGDGPKNVPLAPLVRYHDPEEISRAVKPKAVDFASDAAIPQRDRILSEAASLSPDSPLSITFDLEGPIFDMRALRDAEDEDSRAVEVERRKAQLRPLQEPLIHWLSEHGVVDIEPHWATNSVRALLPAKLVAEAASYPGVVEISQNAKTTPGATWTQAESRLATKMLDLRVANYRGFRGTYTTVPYRIKIGIIEDNSNPNDLNTLHAGWIRSTHGARPSRLLSNKNCINPPSCVAAPAGGGGASQHGTAVAGVALGSILEGQDPSSTLTQRNQRTGNATEAYLRYYLTAGDLKPENWAVDSAT